jgi:hypothetical protein
MEIVMRVDFRSRTYSDYEERGNKMHIGLIGLDRS